MATGATSVTDQFGTKSSSKRATCPKAPIAHDGSWLFILKVALPYHDIIGSKAGELPFYTSSALPYGIHPPVVSRWRAST